MFDLKRISFASVSEPITRTISKDNRAVISYGNNNDFFDYLIDLYHYSSKHNAIINGKLLYLIGNVDGLNAELQQLRERLLKDYAIFGGFALEVHRNIDGVTKFVKYVPYYKFRKTEDGKLCYSDSWIKRRGVFKYTKDYTSDVIIVDRYEDGIFPVSYYIYENIDYSNYYPVPDYNGALQYIELDYRVSNYWNNVVKNGFSASHIIDIFGTGLTEEEKKIIEEQIKDKFAGDDNAGSFVLNFIRKPDEKTNINTIQQPNLDNLFKILNDAVTQEIFIAHRVTSPMLFGIRTEGQLGGRNELLDAYELFKVTYVYPTRNKIDSRLKAILGIDYVVNEYVSDNSEIVRQTKKNSTN